MKIWLKKSLKAFPEGVNFIPRHLTASQNKVQHYLKEYNKIQQLTCKIHNVECMVFNHKLPGMQWSRKISPIRKRNQSIRTEPEIRHMVGEAKMKVKN